MKKDHNKEIKKEKLTYEQLEKRDDLSSIILAGGCFWCMEGPFEHQNGVIEVVSGYAGGEERDPSYEDVVSKKTGHRESVKIYYEPEKISLEKLLDIYWGLIDPTDDGGQFVDRGFQYTTAIFYHTDEEKSITETSKKELEDAGKYEKSVVTEIVPFTSFYPAEDYHQDFYLHSAERYKQYKNNSGRPKGS